MNRDLLRLLACPACSASPLSLVESRLAVDQVEEGWLRCDKCGMGYSIVAGIPTFVNTSADLQPTDLQQQEIQARDRIYRERGKGFVTPVNRYPVLDAVRWGLGDCNGWRILDAGCGNGQTTDALRLPSRLVAMDFSLEGLLNFGARTSIRQLDLVHADGAHMPFPEAVFDAVLSIEVLQHLPSAELRADFIREMSRVLKPGGVCVLIAYNWSESWREDGIPKEGLHDNGIFYHAFEAEELRAALSKHFRVEKTAGVRVQLPRTHRFLKAIGKYNVYWDRLWRTQPAALRYSHLLFAKCRRTGQGG